MISGEALSSVIKEGGSYCMLVLCGCREDEVLYDHELKSLWHFLLERYEPSNVVLNDDGLHMERMGGQQEDLKLKKVKLIRV